MITFILCCLLLAGAALCEEKKSYRGHQVISVKAENEEQLKVLQQLHENNFDLIFLGDPNLMRDTEIVVPPQQMVQVFKTLKAARLSVTLVTADLQSDIDAVMEENTRNSLKYNLSRSTLEDFNHDMYLTMDEVDAYILYIAERFPELATLKTLPFVSENGRPINYMVLSAPGYDSGDDDDDDRPVIMIETLTHAREWITTASMLYVIDKMIAGYQNGDERAIFALHHYTWVIIPVVNPDGYIYSIYNDRMWRKNRKYIDSRCSGVDLNRNYDVEFATTGVSTNCRSDIYPGDSAFSEKETQNVRYLFYKHYDKMVSFLSVHAYSQLLLHSWAYKATLNDPNPPTNIEALKRVGEKMKTALETKGMTYQFGTAYQLLRYAASGSSGDFAQKEKPGLISFTFELRPASSGEGGFILHPSQIKDTGDELFESLYVLAEELATYGDDD